MRFFGFDSFQGLPAVGGVDATPEQHFYAGQYAWPLDRVQEELTKRGADWDKSFLIAGYFQDTLTAATLKAYRMDKVSVVLLDSDLYASAAVRSPSCRACSSMTAFSSWMTGMPSTVTMRGASAGRWRSSYKRIRSGRQNPGFTTAPMGKSSLSTEQIGCDGRTDEVATGRGTAQSGPLPTSLAGHRGCGQITQMDHTR